MNYNANSNAYYQPHASRISPNRGYQNYRSQKMSYNSPTTTVPATRPLSPNPINQNRAISPLNQGRRVQSPSQYINKGYSGYNPHSVNRNSSSYRKANGYINSATKYSGSNLNSRFNGNFSGSGSRRLSANREPYARSPVRNDQNLIGSSNMYSSNYLKNSSCMNNSAVMGLGHHNQSRRPQIRRGDDLRKSLEKRKQNLYNSRLSANANDQGSIRDSRLLEGSNYLEKSGFQIIQPKPNIEKTIPRANVFIAIPGQELLPPPSIVPDMAQGKKISNMSPPPSNPSASDPNSKRGSRFEKFVSSGGNNHREHGGITGSKFYLLEERKSRMEKDHEKFDRIFCETSFFGQFTDDPTYLKQHNFEALKFLEVISRDEGVIFIWDYGAFLYKIDEDGKVEIEKMGQGNKKFIFLYFF